jgi:hypothetical protein
MELGTEQCFVDVVVDAACHFKSYFVGIVAALKILKEGGLDYYSVDACHIEHVMSNGLQYHLLVRRTGTNKFQTIAFSLDLGETADSYQRFADTCREFGFGVLADVEPGPLERVAVAFFDGFKGTTYFTQRFQRMFHARCACRSVRVAAVKQKKAKAAVNAAFHDNQLKAVCKAASKADHAEAKKRLAATSPHALQELHQLHPINLLTVLTYTSWSSSRSSSSSSSSRSSRSRRSSSSSSRRRRRRSRVL